MIILGLNAYHADASAAVTFDGQLVAAAEEERFLRVKHWAGLPARAVRRCLEQADIDITAVDHIAINRNPAANWMKKALYAFSKRPGLAAVRDRLKNASKVRDVRTELERELGLSAGAITAGVCNIEHHRDLTEVLYRAE